MFKCTVVSVTSETVPKLIFTILASANSPAAVDVYNNGTTTIYIGGKTTTDCLRPLAKKTSIQFGIIGQSSLYAKKSGATSVTVIVTVGP